MIKVFVSSITCLPAQASTFSSFKFIYSMATVAFCLLVNLKPAVACHDSEITNLIVVDNGDGTFTYTIDLTVDVGSFDGYGYGFALVFSNSSSLPPTVLNSPAFTPQVTRPGYDPLIGYTGVNIGSGPIPFFSARYGNRSDVLTYETTDDWFGMGSTDYSATISVTVSGCIEEISLDGDFRSLGNAPGDSSCITTISTGFTCCMGPTLTGTVDATICPGETFVYFGTTYDENSTSGTELLSTPEGCDSVVTVNVTIDQNCCNPQTSAISGPTTLCSNATGNAYSVINTPGSTYTWSIPPGATITSGQGTNSITVDFGLSGGQLTVFETLQCGNGPTITLDVVLNPLQNLVITNPVSVCQPNTVDLTNSAVTSGSTGGGTLSYWNNPGASTPLNNPSAVTASGTYYIQAQAGNCSDVESVIVTIDICCNPQTSAISGPSLLCQNSTGHIYSVINTSGSTYTWTVPTDANITAGQGTNSITVDLGISGGQITVVETQQCGNGQLVTFDVVLDPTQNLIITNPPAVCQPNSVDLTATSITLGSTGGGTLSYWSDANGTTPLNNPNAITTSGTSYIQSGIGNCSTIEPVTVTINNCVSCSMDNLALNMVDCYTSGQGNLQYDLEGVLSYTGAPNTGTLTVTDCYGNQQVFNPPFNGTQTFSFSGLPQDGLNCDFTAAFSDDSNCTITSGFVAPPFVTYFDSNCVSGSGQADGTIEFNNSPASGTIVVEISDGNNIQTTNIQPPFNSPEVWQITGLDPAATDYVITYYFSDFPSCQQTQSIICGCSASGGTTSGSTTGNGINDFILCEGDELDIVSNNDFTFPADEGPVVDANGNVFPYQPDYVYLVYSCAPTPGVFPEDDDCFQGIIESNGTLADVNDSNSHFSQFPIGTFTNNQLYYVPVTLYHYDPLAPAYIFNSNCWALGNSISVTYLPPVLTNVTESCQTNTVIVDISGGYPEVFGGDFTASNLLPATASFVNSNTGNGGAIIIEGLQNGDNYSFDITDENGCPVTVSGGPFVAMPTANAGTDGQSCGLTYNLQAVPSHGSGSWSGSPSGAIFLPNNSNPNASVTVTTGGDYIFTWSEDNGNACIDSDDVEISFSQISITAVITDASCSSANGEISITPQGGLVPYTYNWTSGGNTSVESNLGAGNVTVSVSDDLGCSLDSTYTVSQPFTFNIDLNTTDATCFSTCDGTIEIQPDGVGPYTYNWMPNVSSTNTSNALCQDDYEILVTDENGCTQVLNASITGSSQVTTQMSSDVAELCVGSSAILSSDVTGGTPIYSYNWTANPTDLSLISSNQNPTVSPTETTTYTLVVTDANGCESVPSFLTIDVLQPLTLDFILPLFGPDTSVCPMGSATIELSAAGGDGNYNFYILPDLLNPVSFPFETQPTVTTIFDFVVSDGCATPPAYLSSTITVHEIPEVSIEIEPNTGCQPLTVQFSDLTQPTVQGWNWNFGDAGSNSNTMRSEQGAHVYEDAGTYDISLSITTAEGCSADTVLQNHVEVFANPTADFESSEDLVTPLTSEIDFTDLSEGNIADWSWDFGDGENSYNQNPTHSFNETGIFPVVLQVITADGCIDETYVEIEVEPDFTFYVPNAFTPNGDRHNNTFRGYGEGIDGDTYHMTITNRWGERIFYTENIEIAWDGAFKGQQVELGVYVYEIYFRDITGDDHMYHGHVKLVR